MKGVVGDKYSVRSSLTNRHRNAKAPDIVLGEIEGCCDEDRQITRATLLDLQRRSSIVIRRRRIDILFCNVKVFPIQKYSVIYTILPRLLIKTSELPLSIDIVSAIEFFLWLLSYHLDKRYFANIFYSAENQCVWYVYACDTDIVYCVNMLISER